MPDQLAPIPTQTPDPVLTSPLATSAGAIRGLALSAGVRVYKGIPYAAPPLGELRWRAPQRVRPWRGEHLANHFGNACLQPLMRGNALMRQFSFAAQPECGMSEDCLYLNVWTAASSERDALPVIVWLHGGGHRVGAGSHPVSDGTELARHGAVVVSVNYRLGALGYLAHPELTREAGGCGNYACLDVIQALEWVRDHITAFGGDPSCVTLFGQSAGAAILTLLMAAPRAQGLFHRAIAHSGGRLRGGPMGEIKARARAEEQGAVFMREHGAHTAAEMRELPADALYGGRGAWNLIQDDVLLHEEIQAVFDRGAQSAIPLLCGFTRNEATPYPMSELHDREKFVSHLQQHFGDSARQLLELYRHRNDAEAIASSFELRRDQAFAYQPWRLAKLQQRHAPVFLFEFEHAPPLPAQPCHEARPMGGFGAYHGSELWYVFNTLDALPWQWTAVDRVLAAAMSAYWVNFARSGDPNGAALPRWPRFQSGQGDVLLLGGQIRGGTPSNLTALQLFEQYFAR
jgi:para-nitrobenzyl esterase